MEKILAVQKQIKEVAASIATVSSQFSEYQLLLTIPGFGPYIAGLVLAVIGDPWRFNSGRQVLKMAAKMLVIAWTLMKKKEEFNPDFLNKS